METRGLIYLDNAATSFPKPYAVSEAVKRFMLYCGGNPARGGYKNSLEASGIVFSCREKLAKIFKAANEEVVFFTMNTTQGINMVIKGILRKGDRILISDLEHNSVYRPIYKLSQRGYIECDVFATVRDGKRICDGEILQNIAQKVRKNTKMLFCTASSNICSARLPIKEIGALCKERGILFAVDGAQGAGHFDISLRDMNIDALCIPAHKGLLGPQGCGAVLLGEGVKMQTLFEGGNGVASLLHEMPEEGPERYEAGTLPVPAIAGFCEGLDALSGIGVEAVARHEASLFEYAKKRLSELERVKIFLPDCVGAVLLFLLKGSSSEKLAELLGREGFCVRGGFHCSALAHKTLGTLDTGGVRVSFGVFNNEKQIDALCDAVREISLKLR